MEATVATIHFGAATVATAAASAAVSTSAVMAARRRLCLVSYS